MFLKEIILSLITINKGISPIFEANYTQIINNLEAKNRIVLFWDFLNLYKIFEFLIILI